MTRFFRYFKTHRGHTMKWKIHAFFLLSCLSTLAQVSGYLHTYRAAVLEYHPITGANPLDSLAKNAAKYVEYIGEAQKKGVDIIVFPEFGLYSTTPSSIPDPAGRIAPCDSPTFQTTKAVKDLSCASRNNNIYSVINVIEKRECQEGDDSCPERGFYIYNTNVVFDRSGVVIARYAKYNLFGTDSADQPKNPELTYFDTDFGVRFGTFICFDILFSTPAQRLVEQYQIKDFVFSTFWFSELPFLTALQVQRGWSEVNNVNLLASGVNYPERGSFGSGIYNGKFGELVQIMPETTTSRLLIADVPLIKSETCQNFCPREDDFFSEPAESLPAQVHPGHVEREEKSSSKFLRDSISLEDSEVLKPGTTFEKTICSRDFCCDFKATYNSGLNSTSTSNYIYRAVVYNGARNFGEKFTGGVQTCGVILCEGPHIDNCTGRFKPPTTIFKFKEIQIRGNFKRRNSLQIPSTLLYGKELRPLTTNKYEFVQTEKDKDVEVSLELLWPVFDVRTFAIWGRDFTRDNEIFLPDSKAPVAVSGPTLLGAFITFFLFLR